MVKPLTLLKMLHCRTMNSNKNIKQRIPKLGNDANENIFKNMEIVVKKESNDICRICLKEGNIPIYGDNADIELGTAISTFGGIEVNMFDSYPKCLCQSCHSLLQGAILFKKTAQESDEQLRKSIEPTPEIEDHFGDIQDNTIEPSTFIREHKPSFLCKQCDLQFNTFQEYDDHRFSEEHENQKKTCTICDKMYSPSYFKTHMKLHKRKAAYVCEVCGKHFVVQGRFKRHRLTHFYSLPFKCSLCPYKGRFRESLRMHMRSHTGEKPYICDECPQRFISKSNLNKHILTHKKQRDFSCECGRAYYTKREYDLHFKVEHAGIKEHFCNICNKAFGYRKQLMKHQLKVHKREKLRSGRMPIYLKIENMKQLENNVLSS